MRPHLEFSPAMKPLLFVTLLPLAALAADPVQPQKGIVSAAGLHVPVSVDAYAGHQSTADFKEKHVTVGGVPFDLVTRPSADNFFLKAAGWPDWKEDPSKYYADYDKGPATPGDPQRPMFKVPVADYSAVYLLAACDNDRALSNVVSFRIGAMDGPRRTTLHDFAVKVPRYDEAKAPSISTVLPTPAGNVFLVRVQLGKAIAQDFSDEWALDVEVTKELQLAIRAPDPCRFNYRPIGLPSGVHIYGMTFQRSPVQMKVTSDEPGHVFVQPQTAVFHVEMRGVGRVNGKLTLEAVATHFDGETTTVTSEEFDSVLGGVVKKDLTVPTNRLGWHSLTIRLKNGRSELLRRETTFAVLPPDSRKHRDESPFGTWDFGGAHFTESRADVVGPLYVKAGLRYGMFNYTAEERKKYGVLNGAEPRNPDLLAKKLETDPLTPKNVLIFHENAISGAHIMRTPDVFTGRPPYKLDETEQTKFDAMWKEAIDTAKATRERFPDAKISFGNGNPHLMEEFARHKFPRELFDSRGNEAGAFMRMPETQPLDFVANNASLWMDRQILDHYGYKDVPVTQCYEICYPSTNPGNLSLRTQAAYYVRHMIHSLVWGVPVIRPSCISDVGNSYQFSNWGSCGLCFAKPELSPKPSYVAMATLTQQLDGAKFSRIVETGSPVVYAVEFKKKDGSFVTVAWTVRGKRQGLWKLSKTAGYRDITEVVDMMGDETGEHHTTDELLVRLTLSPSPIFISTKGPFAGFDEIAPDWDAQNQAKTKTKAHAITPLAKLADWTLETAPNTELEWFNFENPRRKGDFSFAEVKEFESEKNCLSVRPKLPCPGSPHLPMYGVLALKKPVEIPGVPTEIGLMVNGNGGWGRIIFELEDAGGQRWNSIGAAMKGETTRWMADWMSEKELAAMKQVNAADWNTNDPWQRSRINFEGWRYLKFPLPGQYDGEGYHWPANSQWKSTGDGIVKHPLKFTKLIVEMPEKVLYLNKMITVLRPAIYLKGLQATFQPVQEISVAP